MASLPPTINGPPPKRAQKSGSKTCKLRGYLDAQKKSARKGAPPSKTTSMLESLLVEDKPKKKRTRVGAMQGEDRHQKTKTGAQVQPKAVHESVNAESMWSQVNLKGKDLDKSTPVPPVRTLDDLLVPMRKRPFSRKRPNSQHLNSSGIKKRTKSINMIQSTRFNEKNANIQGSQQSFKSSQDDSSRTSLPTKMVLNIGRSRKPFSKRPNQFPTFSSSASVLSSGPTRNIARTVAPALKNVSIDLPTPADANQSQAVQRAKGGSQAAQFQALEIPIAKRIIERTVCTTQLVPKRIVPQDLKHSTEVVQKQPMVSITADTKAHNKSKKKAVNNDNFVRLNMKNTAGSCKGARSLKKHNRLKRRRAEWKQRTNQLGVEEDENEHTKNTRAKGRRSATINSAIDPLDDFLDGTFHAKPRNKPGKNRQVSDQKPICCARHQRPCKLLTVKKNTSGNKGRKFYACSLPRGEQCDFFQWEDDTVEAAQRELLLSSSHSGFIARQVAAHIDRLKTLTLPELRVEAKRRGLTHTGKKRSVLARLSVWVRDEVSNAIGIENTEKNASDAISDGGSGTLSDEELAIISDGNSDSSGSEDDESDLSDGELEICMKEGSKPYSEGNEMMVDTSKSPLHTSLFKVFGYEDFREGQEWAIGRCLSKKKSLLVAPTGLGKSLCYALPAALMDGVCIVVSPLVSLMEDQLRHLPPSIPAATLSGNMPTKKLASIIDDLLRKRLKILFMSPERLASAAFRRLLRPKYNIETKSYERQLPEISLLCVDEAHCLSQWGHNFRVSYLRLRTLLSKLNPQSVLALTATAGPPVIRDVCHTLNIPHPDCTNVTSTSVIQQLPPENGTKIFSSNRDNIDVAVKFVNSEENRLNILFRLLRSKSDGANDAENDSESDLSKNHGCPIKDGSLSSGSVIIYVWRQKDAEVITEQLKGFDILGGIVCYHGGMDSGARTKSQSQFMRGKARICVATVAFGLGINKADVRGVIHLCLPPSPEHYLQEIGRAGRDGKPAMAIALVVESEVAHKLSLSFSDRISRGQVRTLLSNMKHLIGDYLRLNGGNPDDSVPSYLDLALPITPIVESTDCKEESIQTILSILEDVSPSCCKLLDIEGIIPDSAIVTLKKRSLDKLAAREDIAKCIQKCGIDIDARKKEGNGSGSTEHDRLSKYGGTASQKGFTAYSFGIFECSIVKCSKLLGPNAEPRHVYAALRRLQNCGELELSFNNVGRSIHLRLNKEGVAHFTENGSENWLSDLSMDICKHFSIQDERRAEKVLTMHQIFCKVSAVTNEGAHKKKSKRLDIFQNLIQQYFESKSDDSVQSLDGHGIGVKTIQDSEPHIKSSISNDVTVLLQHPSLRKNYLFFPHSVKFGGVEHTEYTALIITKILHGMESPRTENLAELFRNPMWGRWREIHFHSLKDYVETLL